MSRESLEALKPTLLAMPAAQVRKPYPPVTVTLQEAHDLASLTAREEVKARLEAVGVQDALSGLPRAIEAARQAQSDWTLLWTRLKGEAQRGEEERGYEVRAAILTACDWNFRGQAAQGEVLSRIREGEGLEDLIADLDALADLCEGNRAAFARDQLFDLEGSITAARQQADALRQVLSSARLDDEQLRARDLRDRAWTHLNGLLTELRQAGRYAWQSDAEMSARFTSPYLRRRPRRRPQDA